MNIDDKGTRYGNTGSERRARVEDGSRSNVTKRKRKRIAKPSRELKKVTQPRPKPVEEKQKFV